MPHRFRLDWLGKASLVLSLAHLANADAFKFTATPAKPLITLDEGMRGMEKYTFTNLGTEPVWIFTFGTPRISPVLPDKTDWAKVHYVGEDLSLGLEVDPGGTFQWEYQITTPKADRKPDITTDPDFGLQAFLPRIGLQVREGPLITSPTLPKGSGTVGSFEVKVVDKIPKTPEPSPIFLAAMGAGVLALARARRSR